MNEVDLGAFSQFFAGAVVGFLLGGLATIVAHHVTTKRKASSNVKLQKQVLELKGLNATAGKTIEDLRLWLDTAFGIQDLPTARKTGGKDIDDIEDMWGTP